VSEVNVYVLVQAELGTSPRIVREVGRLPGILSVDQVTGPYDIIVQATARNPRDLDAGIIRGIQGIQGVVRTLPCVAGLASELAS
jgi:DNA-binding Lrp family transcriptional regulator